MHFQVVTETRAASQPEAGAITRGQAVDAGAAGGRSERGAIPWGVEAYAAPFIISQTLLPCAEAEADGGAAGGGQHVSLEVAETQLPAVVAGDPPFGDVF